MVAMPASAAPLSPLQMMKDVKTSLSGNNSVKEMRKAARKNATEIMRMSELAKKMKPGTVKTFGWDEEEWMPDGTTKYTYDVAGHVTVEYATSEDGLVSKTVYEYYPDGMLKSKISTVSEDGINFENYSKNEFEYDPILTDVITDRKELIWVEGEWQNGNCYKRIITRDEKGNITSSVIAVLFQGEYDPTQKLEIVYGEDGKAAEITEKILNRDYYTDEYYWEQDIHLTDIVWDRTDGQIYDAEEIFLGNNRIASAHSEDEDDIAIDMTVKYSDDNDAYTATMNAVVDGEAITGTAEYTPLDNDGYILVTATYHNDWQLTATREECRYDDWGLQTLSLESETEGLSTYSQSIIGEVEYDKDGKPEVYTVSVNVYDDEIDYEETTYMMRAEFSDYIDVTSGSCPGVVDEAAPERYFNLQGMPVDVPEKGRIVVTESGAKKKF